MNLRETQDLVGEYLLTFGRSPYPTVAEDLARQHAVIQGQILLAGVRCAEALERIANKLDEVPPL